MRIPVPALVLAAALLLPAAPAQEASRTFKEKGYTLVLVDRDPSVPQVTVDRMVRCFFATYPAMAARFNPGAARTATLVLDPRMKGVAATGGARMTVAGAWMRSHPDDIDVVTHEAFHIVQAYGDGEVPGWAVEGLADYARATFGVANREGGWTLPDYAPRQRYTDAYRVTARFFLWLETKGGHAALLKDLDAALRGGTYQAGFWTQETGKSVDQLWEAYGTQPGL